MQFATVTVEEGIATVLMQRGKVNAINEAMVLEYQRTFKALEGDASVRTIILTGHKSFFSFGFDIPEFLEYSRDDFAEFLTQFTQFYTDLYIFPKPVIAALNGHTIAGGCMIALACDDRLMAGGKAKIALNEITFGASILAGSVEMLRACVGDRRAEMVLYSGNLFTPPEALELGLIDQIVPQEILLEEARTVALEHAMKDPVAFSSIKRVLRRPTWARMVASEKASIQEFIRIWYSESTWKKLQNIEIR
jgi:3,2-trans-enoyl-CoA isomerase